MKESRQGDIADVIKNKHAVDRRLSTADGGGAIGQVRRHSISRRLRTTSLCTTPSNARRSLTNADETRRANCAGRSIIKQAANDVYPGATSHVGGALTTDRLRYDKRACDCAPDSRPDSSAVRDELVTVRVSEERNKFGSCPSVRPFVFTLTYEPIDIQPRFLHVH